MRRWVWGAAGALGAGVAWPCCCRAPPPHPATPAPPPCPPQGAEIDFAVQPAPGASGPAGQRIRVYTTRPDTLFGATYLVLAPEHPALAGLASEAQSAEVAAYVEAAARKSDLERTELQKDKSGVFTGGAGGLAGVVWGCLVWCGGVVWGAGAAAGKRGARQLGRR